MGLSPGRCRVGVRGGVCLSVVRALLFRACSSDPPAHLVALSLAIFDKMTVSNRCASKSPQRMRATSTTSYVRAARLSGLSVLPALRLELTLPRSANTKPLVKAQHHRADALAETAAVMKHATRQRQRISTSTRQPSPIRPTR